jgi:hypothetical protein
MLRPVGGTGSAAHTAPEVRIHTKSEVSARLATALLLLSLG